MILHAQTHYVLEVGMIDVSVDTVRRLKINLIVDPKFRGKGTPI